MTAPVVTLSGLRCVSARFVMPYTGVFFIDLDVDPALVASVPPAGPVVVTIASTPPVTLTGVIDPLASGSFGATARVRVVAGKGGWSKGVPAQHFPSPGTTAPVYSQTATLVGEAVVVAVPTPVPENYVRLAGVASDVLRDEPSWWVDPTTGITTVGPRPPAVADLSLELISWDAGGQVAEVHCDTLVLPGTVIVDARIGGGQAMVRDVEQVFDASGSRATCMCSTNMVSRLLVSLQTLIRAHCKTGFLKIARYRFVQDAASSTSVGLQAVARQLGLPNPYPDLLPLTLWTGVPGMTADLPPGLEVLVGFDDDNQPVVVGYSTLAPPLSVTIDAVTTLVLGNLAETVKVGVSAALLELGPSAEVVQVGAGATSVQVGAGAPAVAIAGPAGLPAARQGDVVAAGPFVGTITGPCSLKTTIG